MNEPEIFKYAQINLETGAIESISFLGGEVIKDYMIRLTVDQDVDLWDKYIDGEWIKGSPPVVDPPTNELELLKAENEELKARVSFTEDAILALMDMTSLS